MDGSPSCDESQIRTQKEEAAKLHIEQIRTQKFHIGSDRAKPIGKNLHRVLTNQIPHAMFSKELKTLNGNFLRELILNADENEYEENVEPELRFVLTREDITKTRAPATLLVFNNEVGFSKENMECICGIFQSTKKGKRQQQTGNGFKSVFLVSSQPYIFSNGYRVRFQEEPDQDCGVGYIVPQWVSGHPSLSSISDIYGLKNGIPATTIILPLKRDGVLQLSVTEQLSQVCPEILLFLSKLKRLYVRYYGSMPVPWEKCPPPDPFFSICKDVNSDVVRLLNKEMDDFEESCNYYLCETTFPVKPESRVGARMDVQNCVITIALPLNERMITETSSAGIFAFLPTKMITDFPFLVQADFILNSSRDSVPLDNEWNLGIFSCIPSAFVNAFRSLSLRDPMQKIFDFLPAQASLCPMVNDLRDSIRTELLNLEIIPCEVIADMSSHATPQEVVRVRPEFRCLMDEFRREGYVLSRTSESLPIRILLSSQDLEKYDAVLEFVGVKYADDHWYTECIQSLCSSADKNVTGAGIILLLKYILNLMSSSPNDPFLGFLKKIIAKSKCLKTWEGFDTTKSYMAPEKCILLDPDWESDLDRELIPSIDEDFHGRNIHVYKNQLRDIGVKVDPLSVCSLLSGTLSKWLDKLKESFERPAEDIVKIYKFMNKFHWRPEVQPARIFINNDRRDWVPPDMCIS